MHIHLWTCLTVKIMKKAHHNQMDFDNAGVCVHLYMNGCVCVSVYLCACVHAQVVCMSGEIGNRY